MAKVLPPIEQQQLTYPEGDFVQLPKKEDDIVTTIALNQSNDALSKAGLSIRGKATQYTSTNEGLKVAMREASLIEERPWIELPWKGAADFEVTLSYRDLRMAPPNKDTVSALVYWLSWTT